MAVKRKTKKWKSANGRATATKRKKSTRVKAKTRTSAATTTMGIKLPSIKDPLSKSGVIKTITDVTCLPRKDVVNVLETFHQVIEKHVRGGGPGTFVMPGLLKINVVKKPARAARKGINPFTGEEIMIKARPAYKAVKIKALKKLKEMVRA